MLELNVSDLGNVGNGGTLHAVGQLAIDVLARNDPPSIALDPSHSGLLPGGGALGVEEDGMLSLALFSVSDSEMSGGDGRLTLSLACSYGEIGIGTRVADVGEDTAARRVSWADGGLSEGAGEGPWPAVSFSGTLADVNGVLRDLRYVPGRDWNGVDELTVNRWSSLGVSFDVSHMEYSPS